MRFVRIGLGFVAGAIATYALAVGWWLFFSEGAELNRIYGAVFVGVGLLALAVALFLLLVSPGAQLTQARRSSLLNCA